MTTADSPQDSGSIPAASQRRSRALVACLLFLVAFEIVSVTARGPGMTYDEGFYVASAAVYAEWFRHLGHDATDRTFLETTWAVNHEHPPLGKLVFVVGHALWGRARGPLVSMRMGQGLVFGLLVALVHLLVARWQGDRAGIYAALSLMLMPRVLGEAHLASLDLPTAAAWFGTTMAYASAASRGGWRTPLAGVVLGLALLTRLSALAIPAVLVPWGLIWHGRKALLPSLALALALPVFFAGWPWMWIDTLAHLREWIGFLHSHGSIFVHYLGRFYGGETAAPWHYPLVLTIATLPAVTVLAVIGGGWWTARRIRTDALGALILAQGLFVLVLASKPGLPKFDGVRLFVPAFPFLACLAGVGLDRAHAWLAGRLRAERLAALPFAAHFAWLTAVCAWIHPFYLEYYGGLVGGLAGAHRLGLETTYWGDAVDLALLRFVNDQAPEGAHVSLRAYGGLARGYLQMIGAMRPDLQLVDPYDPAWDVVVLNCRQGFFKPEDWDLYARQDQAVFANRRQGVPLALVFLRPTSPPAPASP